ncbi:pantoate--beta-alanine ligase [Pectobacterium parvum]|uniref:pantoate--beta-alanine ligase n=1 Tax=Pectobacterium TaxID=122277 RepID=UPI000CD215D6|nr:MULTISPECIES: pantoate--beta-alanine ligase [Pectobacterium]POE06261.1 hypothetical protein BV921_22630 [Pectobacterium odoriferum]UFK41101.1 pantoate--beta-alanine ligase [Pectobacterium parvum]GKW44186.1 pantoate--beta-alanine ligase [Pectobacterium carotovorum subsp. carotovorum]
MILYNLSDAVSMVNSIKEKGTLGSIHTLGALHEGHAELIRRSSKENDFTLITIYPNKLQLNPNKPYVYNIDDDIALAQSAGASIIFIGDSDQMYPDGFTTFLDQGDMYHRLDCLALPGLYRGMVSMSFRWINLFRPTRSYWGTKDIAQYLLVKRAVKDFLLDVEIVPVPCVRLPNGIPVSSRLKGLEQCHLNDVVMIYQQLEKIKNKLTENMISQFIIEDVSKYLEWNLTKFRLVYVQIVSPNDFAPLKVITFPLVVHICIQKDTLYHFDGLYLESKVREF